MKALLYVVLLFALLLSACGVPTPTPTIEETFGLSPLGTPHPSPEKIHDVGGGDCSADRATGDLIMRYDPWCVPPEPDIALIPYHYIPEPADNVNPTIAPDPTTPPTILTPDPVEPDPPAEEKGCNKGGGNGGEGCDPGKNPDKGNDDESGEKEKKDK